MFLRDVALRLHRRQPHLGRIGPAGTKLKFLAVTAGTAQDVHAPTTPCPTLCRSVALHPCDISAHVHI